MKSKSKDIKELVFLLFNFSFSHKDFLCLVDLRMLTFEQYFDNERDDTAKSSKFLTLASR